MAGNIVETIKKPQYNSVEQYVEKMKRDAPHYKLRDIVIENDGECKCCGQPFPMLAGAILKVEDISPTTIDLQQNIGAQIELCADCYTHGVRPKHIRFGEVKWNKEGRNIQKRAERKRGHPW